MHKKISIIIPCHNVEKTLSHTWHSLKAQTIGMDALTCVFVDDASDDNGATWRLLKEIEAEHPDHVIALQLAENLRQGGARNAALAYATGEYLLFLDADDELSENACDFLYRQAVSSDADIIQFRHSIIQDDDTCAHPAVKKSAAGNRLYNLSDDDTRRQFLTGTIANFGCWNKLYRMDLVKKAGSRFAEHRVYEEPKFVYPLFLYADHVLLVDEVCYLYHWHAGSTMTSRLGERLLDHPHVQLELLEDLMTREEMFDRYHTEIEAQFIFSFYCETILFAKKNRGILPLDFFHHMQHICRTLFPQWEKNPYLHNFPAAGPVLPSINWTFDTQDALNRFIEG